MKNDSTRFLEEFAKEEEKRDFKKESLDFDLLGEKLRESPEGLQKVLETLLRHCSSLLNEDSFVSREDEGVMTEARGHLEVALKRLKRVRFK